MVERSNERLPARFVDRRRVLATIGGGTVAGFAGCLGGTDEPAGNGDGSDPSPDEDVTLFDSDGEQVTLTVAFDPGSSTAPDIAQQIRTDLDQLGIDVEFLEDPNPLQLVNSEPVPDADPDEFDWGPVARNAGPPEQTRTVEDWDMLIGVGGNTFPRTPDETAVFWTRDGPTNAFGYVPSENHNELYAEARQTTDEDRQIELFGEIFANLTRDAAANFLSQSFDYTAFREEINTAPEFNEFGAERSVINRYRDTQDVSGDYVNLGTTPLQTAYPPEADDTASGLRLGLVTDGSYALGTEDQVIPLHLDIEDSGDSQVYVCTLRDNLEWGTDADGNSYGRFTAEDYVFHLEFVHGVAGDEAEDFWDESSPPSADAPDFQVVENVEQTGELEFQLELASVDPVFPQRPIMWGDECLPMELYEQYAPDAEALRQSDEIQEFTWTGNLGPYTFQSRTPGVAGDFIASRNEDYYMRAHTGDSNVQAMDEAWADAPYFNDYQIDIEEETSTVVERMRAGEGDTLGLPTDNVEEFRQAVDGVRVEETPSPFISMLIYNMRSNGDDLLQTVAGRQAVSMVIDKEVISEDIQRGLTEPAVTWQPTWSRFYDDSEAIAYGIDITEETIRDARSQLRDLDGFELDTE